MRRLIPALAAAAMVSLAGSMAFAGGGDPGNPWVVPPQSCAFGQSYAAWSVNFWQWALKLPATQHPLFDTADVSTGQSGPVWFLGGKFCPTTAGTQCNPQLADRTCTIPEGKALFFPIINAEASTIEGNGSTFIDLRNAAQSYTDPVDTTKLACEVDGAPVNNLDQYRALSPLFDYTLAAHDNVWAAVGEPVPDGATTPSVSDGYYVMLAPLPAGKHTLHFHAEIPSYSYTLDVTYHLTVARDHGGHGGH